MDLDLRQLERAARAAPEDPGAWEAYDRALGRAGRPTLRQGLAARLAAALQHRIDERAPTVIRGEVIAEPDADWALAQVGYGPVRPGTMALYIGETLVARDRGDGLLRVEDAFRTAASRDGGPYHVPDDAIGSIDYDSRRISFHRHGTMPTGGAWVVTYEYDLDRALTDPAFAIELTRRTPPAELAQRLAQIQDLIYERTRRPASEITVHPRLLPDVTRALRRAEQHERAAERTRANVRRPPPRRHR